ncbi:MAG: winged helix-turn-helix transcriptional regulator, partial [Candidatus Micrarchaeales archaeon]
RISITEMSKALQISRKSVKDRLLKLEKDLGISYVPEFNETKLGFASPHLILARFNSKPDYDEIARLFSKSYIPQLVVSMSDDSILAYAVSRTSNEYALWDKNMQINLSKYGVDWRTSEVVHRQLGFFPLRNEILERANIPEKYKKIVIALNSNARASHNALAKATEIHFNTLAYNLNKMRNDGYIKRFTISMRQPDFAVLVPLFVKYSPREGYEECAANARKAMMSDDEYSIVSRYLISAPLIGSYDYFTLGAFDDIDVAYKKDVQYHKRTFKKHGIKIVHGKLMRILLGRLPIRSVDTRKEYNLIKWLPEE